MASPHSVSGRSPPTKRSRVLSKVCDPCKQKKARCNSGRSQCETCRRKGTACVYRERGQPGLRPGFGRALEGRLDVLERNMQSMSQTLQQVVGHLPCSASTILQSPFGTHHADTTTNGIDLSAPLNDTSYAAGVSTPSGLPHATIMQDLIHLYSDMIQPWLPLIPPSILQEAIASPDRSLLLHGLIVVCFRFWNQESPNLQQRQAFVNCSRDHILRQCVDTCTVDSTQGLALLAVDTHGNGTGPRAWNVLSMLVAAVRHLNITKASTALVRNDDRDDETLSSMLEREEKRRLYWTIVMLDRFCSIQHGQAAGIQVSPGLVPYPTSDSDSVHASSTPGLYQALDPSWLELAESFELMARVNHLLIQTGDFNSPIYCQEWQTKFRALDMEISRWSQALPHWLKDPSNHVGPTACITHSVHHLSRIRMYTVAAFPSTENPYLKPSIQARGRCAVSILQLAALIAAAPPTQVESLGPLFAFVLWVAARSSLMLLTTSTDFTAVYADPDLVVLRGGLQQLSLFWSCAQNYLELIQIIMDSGNSPGGPQDIDAIRDTKKTTYGLERRLYMLKSRQVNQVVPHAFDFLDMPLFELDDTGDPWLDNLGPPIGDEWLG
ncbi:hypothetical protein KVT40_006518 [Elsinoe batatas]|uniref:Zn(2)-C6 fungal-type domain-containing protein n=1 Tax=Elsinoe batatas TaxID=2601811 RepID=A0A8K0PF09_9PEZI|nr:hypothetical protein KVT40_006518 [Elsinoe batatas]